MAKAIVICSDGTGNTSSKGISSVYRLVKLLGVKDIREVWFRGCHSDVGGGDEEEVTAVIARQWMFSEACDPDLQFVKEGGQRLVISDEGRRFLAAPLAMKVPKSLLEHSTNDRPSIHESLTRFWSFVDLIPRLEIDNSGTWPCRRAQKPGELHALRSPELLLRDGLCLCMRA